MSALAALWELGAQVRLAPDGRLVVAGLNRLPKHQAAKAVEVARRHKAEVLAELGTQAELDGNALPANVETLVRPNPTATRGLESWSCWCCNGRHYFLNTAGQPVCARCHPPLDPVKFPIR